MTQLKDVALGLRGIATNPTAIEIINGYLAGAEPGRPGRDEYERYIGRVAELDWCLTQDFSELAKGIDVRFESVPSCLAYAEKKGDEETILFSLELIDLIKNWLTVSRFTTLLGEQGTEPFAPMNHINLAEAFAFANNLLVYWGVRGAIPLPSYEYLLTDQVREEVTIGVISAIQFILLHELGHLRLGHFSGGTAPVRPASDLLFISEDLGTYQLQELEADAFAISQFKPENSGFVLPAAAIAFWPVFSIEHFYRMGAASHPLMVNRFAKIQELTGADAALRDLGNLDPTIQQRRSYITTYKDFIASVGGDAGVFFEREYDLRFAARVLRQLRDPLAKFGFDILPSLAGIGRNGIFDQ